MDSTVPRRRPTAGDRSPFNPVIVFRSPSNLAASGGGFELFYDDEGGSGLRPLPTTMSEFLMDSGFDRILDRLTQIETNVVGRDHQPASKATVESMPSVEIAVAHVGVDSHCAVCREPFELGTEAKEMPCKHIYHKDCILPWLSLRNSCPICRHELPTDELNSAEQTPVALTIWRLPGGGFAVGRFSGGRRADEREFPIVFTEMDEGFNESGTPRRILWQSRGNRTRETGGIGGAFRSFFSFFRRLHPSSSHRHHNSSMRRSSRQASWLGIGR
ncbi:E3 ubiquitin-protein ligase RDUF2-like [Typha latifolia]|uniref:E3 ubiquitin-protein ligase RDUF2-like n=1 Tax=Typha latifolia TaxID=4733 RepID=UPI003C2CFB5B